MSSTSFIDINLGKFSRMDPFGLIESMLTCGWELNDCGQIVYLPLGDNDSFAWKGVPIGKKHNVLDEIRKKQEINELIGVVVTYKNTQIGGNLLFLTKDNQISFSLSINVKKLENGLTDFSWYEEKILPWLSGQKLCIESIYLCQSDSGGNIKFEKKILGTTLT